MLEFKNLKTNCCPVCGCKIVVSERLETTWYGKRKIWQHTNGGQQEIREFLCGYTVRYSPNFMRDEEMCACLDDPILIQAKNEAERLNAELLKAVESIQTLDDEVKCSIKDRVCDVISANDIYNAYQRKRREVID